MLTRSHSVLQHKGFNARLLKPPVTCLSSRHGSSSPIPSEAEVVIIGGGVIGVSTLYHLRKRGINAILIEKDSITAGTTWHSAGLLWRLRPNDTEIKIINQTRELVKTDGILSKETDGMSCGWNSNGGLFIASTKQRLDEYKRLQTIGKYFGIESHVLTPSETQELYPLMNTSDIVGTLYSPGDGTVEPSDYVNTMARACKNIGGKIYENINVTGFETNSIKNTTNSSDNNNSIYSNKQEITGVETDAGFIKTNKIAICTGVWTRDLCKLFEKSQFGYAVNIPLCAMRHAYVLTDKIEGIRSMPCVRDHDLSVYLRVQGESLQVGGYEQNPMFWDNVEHNFSFSLFDLDWDVFGTHLENGSLRVPIIGETGIKSEVCGPESFTPDHKPLLGQIPEIKGVYLGTGFNSAGVMLSGGCGSELANYIVDGYYSYDMFGYDIMRFHPSLINTANNPNYINYSNNSDNCSEWIKERTHESYAKNYSIVFPLDEALGGRILGRKSHVHKILAMQGCIFQERHGFERPGWFNTSLAQNETVCDQIYSSILDNVENYDKMDEELYESCDLKDYDYYGAYVDSSVSDGQCSEDMQRSMHEEYPYRDCLDLEYTFEFAKNHDSIGTEVFACRNNVAVFDQSYFGKFFLTGNDANAAIDYIATNVISEKGVGSTIYTEMCNDNGRVECDLGVSKIGENEYYITAGGLSCTHDYYHIESIIIDKGFDCNLVDLSSEFSMFSVQGPKSRELLELMVNNSNSNNNVSFDNESFPFGTNQLITIEYNGMKFENIRFIRLTFVGELGWELHVPKECAKQVYCLLFKLGKQFNIKAAGYRAIDSLSCEKGYLHWHEDVSINDTPLEANVGFIVNKKLKNENSDFKGKNALLEQSGNGLNKKLVHVRLDSKANKNNELRLHGLETIYRNGECVGYLKRASYDYTENVAIGTGYVINKNENSSIVDNSYIQGSKKHSIPMPNYEIEILGERYPCQVSTKALFDPKSERVQGNYSNVAMKASK